MSGPRALLTLVVLGLWVAPSLQQGGVPLGRGVQQLTTETIQQGGVPLGRGVQQLTTETIQQGGVPLGRGVQQLTTETIQLGIKKSGNVQSGLRRTYTLAYQEKLNQTVALRVSVSVPKAKKATPVFFSAMQPEQLISWHVPLSLENVTRGSFNSPVVAPGSFDYNEVAWTLCPLPRVKEDSRVLTKNLFIDVSTGSVSAVNFDLEVQLLDNFEVELNINQSVLVTPSESQFFQYTFGPEEESVLVRVVSDDDLCMIVSIQDVGCPVYDRVRNVEYEGRYQTVTRQGSINVPKALLNGGAFFIVFVLLPVDIDCVGIEDIKAETNGTREKQVTFYVEETLPRSQYIVPVLGAVALYVGIIILSLIAAIVYQHCLYAGTAKQQDPSRDSVGTELGTSVAKAFITHSKGPATTTASRTVNEGDIGLSINSSDRSSKLAHYTHKDVLYCWNFLPIAIYYFLPVVQLVLTFQKLLYASGNQDICYYNFHCANPLGVLSSFNNVFSNSGYVLLGLLFIVIVYIRQRRVGEDSQYGLPEFFGLYYAMGSALIMEGFMSGCYHVCPSYTNFQFDTAFMYMMAWLCMLKIYQKRHPDINTQAHVAYFAIAWAVLLAVLGVVYGHLVYWILASIVHMVVILLLTSQVYYSEALKLVKNLCQGNLCSGRPEHLDRVIFLVFGNIINLAMAIIGLILQSGNFASHLLNIFIVNLTLYLLYYIFIKLRSGENVLRRPFLFLVIILQGVCWGFALSYFFAGLTEWTKLAAQSRSGNRRCLLFGFYDEHDVWHFLSAISLFLSFMTVLILDDDLIYKPRDSIEVF